MGSSNSDYVNAISDVSLNASDASRFLKEFFSINLLPFSQHILRLLSHIWNTIPHIQIRFASPPLRRLWYLLWGALDSIHAREWEEMKKEKSWWKLWYKWEKLWKSLRLRLKWQTSGEIPRFISKRLACGDESWVMRKTYSTGMKGCG